MHLSAREKKSKGTAPLGNKKHIASMLLTDFAAMQTNKIHS